MPLKRQRAQASNRSYTHPIYTTKQTQQQKWFQVYTIREQVERKKPSWIMIEISFCSYQILNPGGIVGIEDPKKCGQLILESTTLDPDMYRIGHTKA